MTVKSLKEIISNLDDSKKIVVGKSWELVKGKAYEVQEDMDIHILKDCIVLVPTGDKNTIIS
jgi:hypothetical protein